MNDTTQRAPSVTLLDEIRNLRNGIACLTLRRINRTHSRIDLEQIERLQKKLDRLERKYTAEKYQQPQRTQ